MKNTIIPIFRLFPPKIFYSKTISPVENIPLPESITVLIHKGDDSAVNVKPGDSVKSGEKIGISGNHPVFSTITGNVADISELQWLNGETYTTVRINRQGEDNWEYLFSGSDNPAALNTNDILSRLELAGYPAGVFKEKANTIIINCCEQDISLSSVQATITEKKDSLKTGISLAKKISGCERIILAVQSGFESSLSGITDAVIKPVKPVYPWCSGDLLPRYLNIQEPAVVIDAELLINIAETLASGLPVHEKIITIVGEGNLPKKNIRIRTGTPVSEILKYENIQPESCYKLILGGAMRGRSIYNDNIPVQIDTDGLIIQGIDDITEVSAASCLNCGLCVQACPQNLQVNLLARYSEFSLFERCEELNIWDCIECGMCAYVCTSHRPMVQFLQFAKKEILKRQQLAREVAANDE